MRDCWRRIPPQNWLKALLSVLALALLAGCATSFVYERADRLAHRWVGGYLDLDPGQQALLERRLEELHDWHRSAQLPGYGAWLQRTAARIEAGPTTTAAEMRALGEELGQFWAELARAAAPLLIELGRELDDAQVASLLAALRAEQQQELEESLRRSEAWHERRRARSMERFVRRWTGSLSGEQQAQIRAWAAEVGQAPALTFENRRGWVDELEQALAHRHDPAVLAAGVERLFVQPASRWSPEYRARVAATGEATAGLLASIVNGLDDRQRSRAVSRFARLAAEFEDLSGARLAQADVALHLAGVRRR